MSQLSDVPPLVSVGHNSDDIKLYKRRYLVCIAFGLNSIMNQVIWITFAPIQSRAADFYNVTQNEINIYSLVFMICYIPGSLLCANMFKSFGLRKSFLFITTIQTIGAGLRYLGSISSIISNDKHDSYMVVLGGQILVALIQPFFTNSPARLAAEWFSVDGRDLATALLSIVGTFGVGIGTILPTLFVTSNSTQYGGFAGLMLTELIASGVGLVLMIIFLYDKPPTAPSISQRLKLGGDKNQSLGRDFVTLMTNGNFLCLFCGFGIGLGIFNAMTTLINQYTALFGYDTDDAGIFGASLIGGGLIGAIVGGLVMERFRTYNSIIKVFTILTVIVMAFLLYSLQPNNFVVITILFGCTGFSAVPIIAVAFEAAAEVTYPVNEELSSGILMTAGQIFGIIYIIIWGYFLSEVDHLSSQNNFSTWFVSGNIIIMLLFVLIYNGEYKRLNAERQIHSLVNSIDDTTITSLPSPTKPPTNGNAQLLTNPLTNGTN